MLDFVKIVVSRSRKTGITIFPEFIVGSRTYDLMIKGRSFYAVWDEEQNTWLTKEEEIQRIIDQMIFKKAKELETEGLPVHMKLMSEFSSNKWVEWQRYCKTLSDNYHVLDNRIMFSNHKPQKDDYATRTLSYPLEPSSYDCYNRLMQVLYDPSELQKIEWAIGSVISGDSTWIQKFLVLYGSSGTGKSTILNIIQDMFPGYYSLFDAKELGSNNSFSMESMKDNTLIAIQHDGDLSRIEDNTRLNSIVSHEEMTVNEKYKNIYTTRFQSFLFMGTNKSVKITESKSGIIRRLIDVTPTGNKVPIQEYNDLMNGIRFEYSGIAYHCLQVYENLGPNYYNNYVPIAMIQKTNDFYNFIEDNYDLFAHVDSNGLVLKTAWLRYKQYCEDANIAYPMSMRVFKDELKNYFEDFKDRYNGQYSVYFGFLKEKFENYHEEPQFPEPSEPLDTWLHFDQEKSEFDDIFRDYPAQYARDNQPSCSWDKCKTKLADLDTRQLHYVGGLPLNLICIDFDIKNEKGEKDFAKNLEAASRFPPTYAELSKSGAGIHLLYYYSGDPNMLSRVFAEDIEVKVFNGKSSLRRMLTKCNNLLIATISCGLPLREVKNMVTDFTIKSERMLRELIKKNLRKEIHAATKPSVDFIYKILEDAYNSGLKYDVRDLRPEVQSFALGSTHQAEYCVLLISKMKFCSDESSENIEAYEEDKKAIIFFDVEVFPNLFVICWKEQGDDKKVVKMINPSPEAVRALCKFRLVGFNNRKYDNHILYARMMGYTEEQLFKLSQRIVVDQDREAFFGEAYNLSYTDIYDFLSAQNKMSLKKWEIKLGIHHQECPYRWDQSIPEDKWHEVADYCANDVVATEATFNANQADWLARQILADLADLTVNDTTNNCTTRIIVGNDKNPQSQFIYTDLSTIFPGYEYDRYGIDHNRYKEGTKIVSGKSIYMGEDPGEGGYVYAEPGMYGCVAVLDVASMHPHSAIRLKIFGEYYTKKFEDIVEGRVDIKHNNYDAVRGMFDGKIDKWLDRTDIRPKDLANGLKTAINSVYGLTSAAFPNKLRDHRNVDNIVAKYGALFMINLKHEVQKRGYTVAHIKTDSIKIPNATPEIIQFVMNYGKEYGFTFEHESTYSKMCLVNDAVYIAQVGEEDGKPVENPYWTATGTQFQVPYVFKTLFSKEAIEFNDLCETKSVTSAMYLDFNEHLDEEHHDYRFVGRIGSFCPIKPGYGGGVLLRESVDKDGNQKFSAVTGTKKPGKGEGVYRWLEAETVLEKGLQEVIDRSYYNSLVDDAVETISKYGDFERFVSDDPFWLDSEDKDLPFELDPNFPMNQPEKAA